MAEYIDRETVIKSLEKLCDRVCQYSKAQRNVMCSSCPLGDAFTVIEDDIPPANVRPVVRGEWVPEPDRHYHWHCSECGYTVGVVRMDCKYCPNCGANMKGGDADGNEKDWPHAPPLSKEDLDEA